MKERIEIRNIPERYITRGYRKLDEIVGYGQFHLEQMGSDHWWLCFDVKGRSYHVNLFSKTMIEGRCEPDPVPVKERKK